MNFFKKYQKIFILIGFIILVAVIGYLLYALFLKPIAEPPAPLAPTEAILPPGFPEARPGEPQVIAPERVEAPVFLEIPERAIDEVARGDVTIARNFVDTPSLRPSLGLNGSDLKYYNQADGKFYRIDKNGQAVLLSDKVFFNVEDVTWSPTQNKAILEYPDGSNIVYNFQTRKQITLPAHWEEFNFAPQGDKIVMKSMGLDPGNRWLTISNDDGSGARRIEPMGIYADKMTPSWSPNNQIIAMYSRGLDFDRQEIFFVGLNDENFKSTVIHGRGFEPKWNVKGDKLLYSVYSSDNGMKPTLWSVNAQGENINTNRKRLNINTWAHKCAFAKNNQEVYCAVPRALPEMSGVFDEISKTTDDRLFKINIETGERKLIATPNETYSMSDLVVSDDENYLYFLDNAARSIRQIKLK